MIPQKLKQLYHYVDIFPRNREDILKHIKTVIKYSQSHEILYQDRIKTLEDIVKAQDKTIKSKQNTIQKLRYKLLKKHDYVKKLPKFF